MSHGLTPGVPGAPEPRMYLRSGYFLVVYNRVLHRRLRVLLYQNQMLILYQIHNSYDYYKDHCRDQDL